MTQRILTIAVDDSVSADDLLLVASTIRAAVPGTHVLGSVNVSPTAFCDFEHDEIVNPSEGAAAAAITLPLSEDDARSLMAADGFVTVVTTIDIGEIELDLSAPFETPTALDAISNYGMDQIHDACIAFGVTDSSAVSILGAYNEQLVIEYSTYVAPFLED